ncbi:MAG: tetratricopeptide repeat protein [Thermoguttaceae bacterium]
MINVACVLLSLLVSATPMVSPAGEVFVKERTADDLYGRGVHAYYAKDYDAAKKLFDEVEKLGSTDPRPYFFLGLTLLKLDKKSEADVAFRKAASLEWESRNARDYGVSGALTRVQGIDRVYLEQFRTDARRDAKDAAERDNANRFGNQPALTDVATRRAAAKSGDTERQTAVEYSPIWFRPARPFVGKAAFGARSVDPFRVGYDDNVDNVISGGVVAPVAKPAPTTPRKPAVPATTTPALKTPAPTPPAPAPTKSDNANPVDAKSDDADPFN